MIIPNILLQNEVLKREYVQKKVEACSLLLKDKGIKNTDLILIKNSQSVETIYWIIACFLRKQSFSILAPSLVANEFIPIRDLLAPRAIIGSGGRVELFLDKCNKKNKNQSGIVLLPTSGTSGKPKIIVLSFNNFQSSAQSFKNHYGLSTEDVWLGTLPLHFIGGLSIVTRALILGNDLAFAPKFTVESMKFWLKSGNIAGVSLVPTMVDKLLREKAMESLHRSIKWIVLGGAMVGASLAKKILSHSRKLPIYIAYGMTESCSQIAASNTGDSLEKRLSNLRLFDEVRLRLEEDGELFLRGPMLASQEYTGRALFPFGGWFPTGDQGVLHADGSFSITGRKSNIIISGGVNINPEEIESELLGFGFFKGCAVLGAKDDYWGERLVALYTREKPLTAEQLKQLKFLLNQKINPFKRPKEFFHVPELPYTSTKKIDRSRLKNFIF